jgi:hypothetical protein
MLAMLKTSSVVIFYYNPIAFYTTLCNNVYNILLILFSL